MVPRLSLWQLLRVRIYPHSVHHVGASLVSLAPIFCEKSRSAHLLACKRPRGGLLPLPVDKIRRVPCGALRIFCAGRTRAGGLTSPPARQKSPGSPGHFSFGPKRYRAPFCGSCPRQCGDGGNRRFPWDRYGRPAGPPMPPFPPGMFISPWPPGTPPMPPLP